MRRRPGHREPPAGGHSGGWIRLAVAGHAGDADELAERLRALGAGSVEFTPAAGSDAIFADGFGESPRWRTFEVAALFASRAEADEAARRLQAARPGDTVRLEAVPERDWVAAGRAGFRPRRFGRRLWIVPAWETPPEPAAANVLIEPGLAFGTGMHPSTALCLEWLAREAPAGRCVLDYGTGSGILAVAAARLGARRVVAVDTDIQALDAARANARLNALDIAVMQPDALGDTMADQVIANILAVPLVALASELTARMSPGGSLALAGITDEQADVVAAAYAGRACVVERASESGWTLLVLKRR